MFLNSEFCIDKCYEWLATFSAALAPEEFFIVIFSVQFFFNSSIKKNIKKLEALNQTSCLW